jgi:hypothetical protein
MIMPYGQKIHVRTDGDQIRPHQVPWDRTLERVAQPLQTGENGRLGFALRQVCLSS